MYLSFFPAQNFLRDFPVNNRPICNILPRPETRVLAEILGKHYGVDVVSRPSSEKSYSFFLGPLSLAPSSLLNKLPDKIKEISPRCFVSLIPDINNPFVWIGGKSVSDFLQTVKFLNNILLYLLQHYLMAGDFHFHTTISDGKTEPEDVCYFAAHAGLDAIAVTDHDNIDGAKKVQKYSPKIFPVITGEELTDKKGNHLLFLGIEKNILKGITPKALINKWRFSNLLIVQAHATDQTYFMREKNRAIGVEAFNFLSSAPQKGRNYAEESLKKGHLSKDIGKARTYLLIPQLNSHVILQSIREGETVAFYGGNFCGKESLQKFFSNLYLHSNLLSGKLVPLSEMVYYGFPHLRRKKKSFLIKKGKEVWYQVSLPSESGVVKVETTKMVEGYLDGELAIFGNSGGVFPFSP